LRAATVKSPVNDGLKLYLQPDVEAGEGDRKAHSEQSLMAIGLLERG
jgi:hypothetical protein